ncbi:ribonuclease H2 subunit A-like [Ruditapes philippinarum]|uniref:ribonuclease H2 subunit A-like n=1 Tax=Ruditapes philippinarum TaxID=129788 RepID=UPI00295B55E1|nr:ribonuclease H2 subunit A-like [Ruditapes philippinarum]
MDQTSFENDNTSNCIIGSEVPDATKSEPCWLGIDEAGRGPVLGPMVYGTCYSPICKKQDLEDLKFADSKTLTEEQRESIFEKLNGAKELIGWMVEILSPTYISNSMLRRSKYNLNALSHDCAIGLIQRVLDQGVNVAEIYVDTVGDPVKYQDKLKALFPSIDITVAKKADADYQIVGAASICAKVARDKAVKSWSFGENIETDGNYGSGYPSDPSTKKFMSASLDHIFGFPQFVRFSWSTADKIIQKNGATFKWEDDEEEENQNVQSLIKFMGKKDEATNRHRFYKERCLSNVTNL